MPTTSSAIRSRAGIHPQRARVVPERVVHQVGAYTYYVFMNWREVIDDEQHHYAQVAAYLQGGGVPSMDDASRELYLQPVHGPFKELVNAGMLNWFDTERVHEAGATLNRPWVTKCKRKRRASSRRSTT